MHLKNNLIAALALAVLVLPGVSFAQTQSVAELQAELTSLMAQMQSLQQQLAALQGGGTEWCYTFTSNMQVGATGANVSALQTALTKDGESVDSTGTFDDQTASAVTGFQQKYASSILAPNNLKYGTGYVGAATRAELNSLFGCGATGITTPTTETTVPATPVTQSQTSPTVTMPTQTVPAQPPTSTTAPVNTSSHPATIQSLIQALMAQLQALQSQPSTSETQTQISAILQEISALQGQLAPIVNQGSGTTYTIPAPEPTTLPSPSTEGNGNQLSFSGYMWAPIRVSYDSMSSFGDWLIEPSTGYLHQDESTALHYKIVAASLPPVADVDVKATVSLPQGTEMGVCARMNTAGDGYCFATSWGGGTYPQIAKFSGGDQNPAGIASAQASYPVAQNTDYVVELQVQGSSISGRIYPAGATAPTAWTVQTTDSSFTSGLVGFYAYGSRPYIESVTVTPLSNTTSVTTGTTTAVPVVTTTPGYPPGPVACPMIMPYCPYGSYSVMSSGCNRVICNPAPTSSVPVGTTTTIRACPMAIPSCSYGSYSVPGDNGCNRIICNPPPMPPATTPATGSQSAGTTTPTMQATTTAASSSNGYNY